MVLLRCDGDARTRKKIVGGLRCELYIQHFFPSFLYTFIFSLFASPILPAAAAAAARTICGDAVQVRAGCFSRTPFTHIYIELSIKIACHILPGCLPTNMDSGWSEMRYSRVHRVPQKNSSHLVYSFRFYSIYTGLVVLSTWIPCIWWCVVYLAAYFAALDSMRATHTHTLHEYRWSLYIRIRNGTRKEVALS